MRLALGQVGVEGVPAIWDTSIRPHGLVVGQTGAGKTQLARVLIGQAREAGEVWIGDGKGGDDFESVFSDSFASGPTEVVAMLDRLADEVERRMDRIRRLGTESADLRPLLCVVDELAAVQLRRRVEDVKAARDRKERMQASLAEVALTGRSAKVSLLVLLQRPDADAIPGAVRDQLGLRIALGWMSADGYRMVFGTTDLQPPSCLDPGNGWISGHDGHRDQPRLFRASAVTVAPHRYGRTLGGV